MIAKTSYIFSSINIQDVNYDSRSFYVAKELKQFSRSVFCSSIVSILCFLMSLE